MNPSKTASTALPSMPVLAELKEQNTIEQFIVEAKKLESAAE